MLTQYQDNISQDKRLKVKVNGEEITPQNAVLLSRTEPLTLEEKVELEARYAAVEAARIRAHRTRKGVPLP